MIIVLGPHTFLRLQSARTGQTLLHASRLDRALIVYGDACRDHYDLRLDGEDVRLDGTLWDRIGPAVSFGDDAIRFHCMLIDFGSLSEDHDGSWQRDRS